MEVPPERLEELAEKVKKLDEMERRIKNLHSMLKGKLPKGKSKMLIVSREVNEFLKRYGFKEREELIVRDIKELPPIEAVKTIFSGAKDKIVYYTEDDKKFKNLIKGYKKAVRSALSKIPEERREMLKEYFLSLASSLELFDLKFEEEVARNLITKKAHEKLGNIFSQAVLKSRKGEIKSGRDLERLFH